MILKFKVHRNMKPVINYFKMSIIYGFRIMVVTLTSYIK